MAAIEQDLHSGEMVRSRAVHGNAKQRDAWHAAHEYKIRKVEDESDLYLDALVKWIAVLSKEAVLSIVDWHAQEHGLTFYESLHKLFSRGDGKWIGVCQSFGRLHA
jgi:hypothetical protein